MGALFQPLQLDSGRNYRGMGSLPGDEFRPRWFHLDAYSSAAPEVVRRRLQGGGDEVIGSLYVNGYGDSQLVINSAGCTSDSIRLCILNHDEGETAYVVVDKSDLLERIKEATK